MTTARPNRRRAALALALVALGGCAAGPDYVRPRIDVGTGYGAATAATDSEREVAADWWTLLGNPALNALVDEALQASPSLQAARQALRASQELRLAQQAAFWPQVQLDYTPTRTKIAGNLGGNSPGVQGDGSVISTTSNTPAAAGGTAPFNSPVIYDFHTAQVSVSYAPDVFGSNRRQVEAAAAQEDAQRFEWHAARVTLAANLAATAIQDALLREQIRSTEAGTAAARATAELATRLRRAGYTSAQDEAQQQAVLLAQEQALPGLQLQLEQNRNLMRALLGAPQDRALPAFALADFRLPGVLPSSLPSRLLEQRPDVRAAEAQLQAATAQLGVARAARLPQFTITANAGGAAAHLSQMLWSGGRFFDLTGNLIAPIFDAGAAKHRELAADAVVAQSEQQYRATVITALQGVADVLRATESDTASIALAQQALDTTQRAWSSSRQRLAAGYADRASALAAEQAWHQAHQQLATTQAARLTHVVALCQALGGGWWSSPDTQLSETKQ